MCSLHKGDGHSSIGATREAHIDTEEDPKQRSSDDAEKRRQERNEVKDLVKRGEDVLCPRRRFMDNECKSSMPSHDKLALNGQYL